MASDGLGQDPLANMQNLIGYAGLVGPNPYLTYQGKIPMAGFYTGDAGNLPPTGATGQPIQSFVNANNTAQAAYQQALAAYNAQPAGGAAPTPGTTLNSVPGQAAGQPQVQTSGTWAGQGQGAAAPGSLAATPAMQELMGNYAATQAAKSPQQLAIDQQQAAMLQQKLQRQDYLTASANAGGGFGQSPGGAFNPGGGYPTMMTLSQPASPAAAAGSGRGPPPAPPDMRQAYLNALANPGPLPQYGAGPPQAGQTPTGTPSANVTNAFLAANAGKSTPFINTLKQLQG